MKLKKINEEHYVVVDETEIKQGDYVLSKLNEIVVFGSNYTPSLYKKITHSTQPIDKNGYWGKVMPLTLTIFEIKELLGEVDVEKRAKENYVEPLNKQGEKRAQLVGNGGLFGFNKFKKAFKKGYNQAIEDNKEKKYTKAQLIWAIQEAYGHGQNDEFDGVNKAEKSIIVITNYLQPKTEWEVEFINGKLTIL